METQKFEHWCLLELFGHNRIAGLVTEAAFPPTFLRIDVPETSTEPAFTRILSPGSLYAINPITEEVAKIYAENLKVKPIDSWDIRKVMEKIEQNKLMSTSSNGTALPPGFDNYNDDGD